MEVNAPHIRYKNQTPRERTWTIHLIAIEKTVKGLSLAVVALRLLTLLHRDVHAWALDLMSRHGIDIESRYAQLVLERLVGVGDQQLVEFGVIAIIWAALYFIEGFGLWMQKRWAEYLTAIATGLFIPAEMYELWERFTWVRVLILGLNTFVLWYLSTRLRDENVRMAALEQNDDGDQDLRNN